MGNITSQKGGNIGGISRIRIAPVEWVLNMPTEGDILPVYGQPLTLADGHSWVELTPQSESAGIEIRPKSTANGPMHELELVAVVNLAAASTTEQLDYMQRLRCAVLLVDNNNTQYLVGDQYHGAELQYSTSVNPDPEGKTAYEITLTHAAEYPVRLYKPE